MNHMVEIINNAVCLLSIATTCAKDEEGVSKHLQQAANLLTEALSLLPEWQEFDPKREETWPKELRSRILLILDSFSTRDIDNRRFIHPSDFLRLVATINNSTPYVKP